MPTTTPDGKTHNFPLPPEKRAAYTKGQRRASLPSNRRRIIDFLVMPDPLALPSSPLPTDLPDDFQSAITYAATYRFPDPREQIEMDLNLWGTIPENDALLPIAKDYPPYTEDAPWQKMEVENGGQYGAFLVFRDMGMADRTLTGAAKKTGHAAGTLNQYATKYDWHNRVAAWDAFRERVYTTQVIERTKEMAEHHADVAAKGISALSTAFTAILHRLENDEEGFMAELSEHDAAKLLSIARASAQVLPNLMNAERLSRGLPTELSASIAVVDQRVTIHTRDDLAAIAFGLADVLAGSQESHVIDVRGRDTDSGEEADPED